MVGKRKLIYRMFEGERFRLYATADTKPTALTVADAMRTRKGTKYFARVTKTGDKKRPYKIWIRARRAKRKRRK